MSILFFPNEILCLIFSFIDDREKIKIGMCCKQFQQILYNENYWEKRCKELFGCKRLSNKIKSWRITFIRKSKDRCIHHIKNAGRLCKILNIKICPICRISNPNYKLIVKTEAIKQFKLEEDDLIKLYESKRYIGAINPYNNKRIMTLFLRKDIQQIATQKLRENKKRKYCE